MVTPATPERRRATGRPYLAGALVAVVAHWSLAAALWWAALGIGARRCLDDAYGLAVEGGGVTMTDDGCVVDVPTTTSGSIDALLPALDSGWAAASAIVAALGAVWPLVLFLAHHRELGRLAAP